MKNVSTFGRNEYVGKQGSADRAGYSGRVDGQLLAMLDLANLKNDLTRDDFRPLDMHYRELELAIYRYRPTESPTSALQQPSGSGPPDAGSMHLEGYLFWLINAGLGLIFISLA